MCRGVFFFLHSFAVNLIKWEASCLPKWPEALEGESTQTFSFPGNRIYTKCFLFARCLVFKRKICRFLKKFSWKGKVLFERLENNFFSQRLRLGFSMNSDTSTTQLTSESVSVHDVTRAIFPCVCYTLPNNFASVSCSSQTNNDPFINSPEIHPTSPTFLSH